MVLVATVASFALVTTPAAIVAVIAEEPVPVTSPETVMLWLAVRYACDLTKAVVATAVELSAVVGVAAVADDPSATVLEKVFAPEIVWALVRVQKAPVPPIASTVPPVMPM